MDIVMHINPSNAKKMLIANVIKPFIFFFSPIITNLIKTIKLKIEPSNNKTFCMLSP